MNTWFHPSQREGEAILPTYYHIKFPLFFFANSAPLSIVQLWHLLKKRNSIYSREISFHSQSHFPVFSASWAPLAMPSAGIVPLLQSFCPHRGYKKNGYLAYPGSKFVNFFLCLEICLAKYWNISLSFIHPFISTQSNFKVHWEFLNERQFHQRFLSII